MSQFKRFTSIALLSGALIAGKLLGCGSDGSPQIGVAVDPECIVVPLGATQDFCAAAMNASDSSVSFKIVGGDALSGSLTQVSSIRTSYKAPAAVPPNCIVNIQASSNQDPTSTHTITVFLKDAAGSCPSPDP
ncbi:MAG: hypothetical protein JNK65_08865, partial [Deltaproteobacteria bacterium]|nr:hypothetical protein [Deltaproteobacteria bacterium]